MAKGRDKHDAHQAALAALGRELSRRARSSCELCEERASLQVVEVPGGPSEPEVDWALMLCERCRLAVANSRRGPGASELRFIEGTAWSEIQPVQITAVRLARRLADEDVGWARDLVDGLYLDEAIEALL